MLPTPARLQLMLTHHTLFSVFIPIVFGNITLQNTKFKIFISILSLSLSPYLRLLSIIMKQQNSSPSKEAVALPEAQELAW